MTHLAIIEYINDVPVVVVDYGPMTQDDFEQTFRNGVASQKDWIEMFYAFHETGRVTGIWTENGFEMPYTVGSFVRFLLGEVQKKEKGIIPKEWYTGLKGMTLRGALNTLLPLMDEGKPVQVDFERMKQIGEHVRVLLARNVSRNPELLQIPGIEKLHLLNDANTNPE